MLAAGSKVGATPPCVVIVVCGVTMPNGVLEGLQAATTPLGRAATTLHWAEGARQITGGAAPTTQTTWRVWRTRLSRPSPRASLLAEAFKRIEGVGSPVHPMNEKAAHAGAATQLNSARSFPGDASSERKSSSSIGTREENSNSKAYTRSDTGNGKRPSQSESHAEGTKRARTTGSERVDNSSAQ